jgi:penicillin-binding protein-related factor A (putative recombinase)
MSKSESTTIRILKDSLELNYPNGFYKKIPDPGSVNKKSTDLRFTPPRGIDIVYYHQQIMLGLEAKFVKDRNRFPFKKVTQLQKDELLQIAQNGGNSYIVVQLYEPHSCNVLSFIEIFDFIHWESTHKFKSISWGELLNNGHVSFCLKVRSKSKDKNKRTRIQFVDLSRMYLIGE